MGKKWILSLAAVLVLLLSGCAMQSVEDMYRLPKRSEEFTDLQSVISQVMDGLEYSAPIAGENRQTVQSADLDGDGKSERILFAKGTSEKPLQIFIFANTGGRFRLIDSIECSGSAFEQVEYVALNEAAGFELVVGRQVSDQVLRSVSVYSMVNGHMEQLLTANYAKYLCTDLQNDDASELLLLRPGQTDAENGIAELYSFRGGAVNRSAQVPMSAPADSIRRIISGRLENGQNAVFVASSVDQNAIITDVLALVNGEFTNVTISNDSGTSVGTLRNYYVYADDIDNDGILELPALISMQLPENDSFEKSQYLIRWYSMQSDGSKVDKLYTYHNYEGGWYIELDSAVAEQLTVSQRGNAYYFYLWNADGTATQEMMSVYVLTGQKREEQATEGNRFVLYRSESTVYAAKLEVAAAAYNMTKDNLIAAFHMIQQDWKTGET